MRELTENQRRQATRSEGVLGIEVFRKRSHQDLEGERDIPAARTYARQDSTYRSFRVNQSTAVSAEEVVTRRDHDSREHDRE